MDHFLNTNLPGIVWASFLCVAFGLFLLKGRSRDPEGHATFLVRFFEAIWSGIKKVIALILIALGIGSFLIGRKLQEFPVLAARENVAQVDVMWMHADSTGSQTMLSLSRQDDPLARGNNLLISLPSRYWAIRAHILRWPGWAAALGFRPVYRLEKTLSWTSQADDEPDWSDTFTYSRLVFWNNLITYGSYFHGFSIEETDSRKVTAAEGTHYVIAMSPRGLEVNEEITQREQIPVQTEEV